MGGLIIVLPLEVNQANEFLFTEDSVSWISFNCYLINLNITYYIFVRRLQLSGELLIV